MTGEENPLIAARTERTRWFLSDRFGMFIHWGLYAIPARGEWVRSVERISNEAYQTYFDKFNPTLYDPKSWASLAKQTGMKYAVLTTKHVAGHCLWPSKQTLEALRTSRSVKGSPSANPHSRTSRKAGVVP